MSRPQHYSPAINRFLVKVLYHEAQGRGIPMTVLANQMLEEALRGRGGVEEGPAGNDADAGGGIGIQSTATITTP